MAAADPALEWTETRKTPNLDLLYNQGMDTLPTLSFIERILFLKRVPLFADLAPADLKDVAAIAREHLYTDGEMIAEEGEVGDEMHIIVSGEMRVMFQGDADRPKELARRRPGDAVGEMSIISQQPRMASLIAVGDVRVLTIEQKQFEGVLRERPETRLAVLRVLSNRLRDASG